MNRTKSQTDNDRKRQKQQSGGDQDDQRRQQQQQDNEGSKKPGEDPGIQEDDSVTDVETERKGRPPKVEDTPR
jgi:hypothetical protein